MHDLWRGADEGNTHHGGLVNSLGQAAVGFVRPEGARCELSYFVGKSQSCMDQVGRPDSYDLLGSASPLQTSGEGGSEPATGAFPDN